MTLGLGFILGKLTGSYPWAETALGNKRQDLREKTLVAGPVRDAKMEMEVEVISNSRDQFWTLAIT